MHDSRSSVMQLYRRHLAEASDLLLRLEASPDDEQAAVQLRSTLATLGACMRCGGGLRRATCATRRVFGCRAALLRAVQSRAWTNWPCMGCSAGYRAAYEGNFVNLRRLWESCCVPLAADMPLCGRRRACWTTSACVALRRADLAHSAQLPCVEQSSRASSAVGRVASTILTSHAPAQCLSMLAAGPAQGTGFIPGLAHAFLCSLLSRCGHSCRSMPARLMTSRRRSTGRRCWPRYSLRSSR
jgi:hypothetical protein